MSKYRDYLYREYDCEHRCFALVRDIYEEQYGLDLGPFEPDSLDTRLTRLHEFIATTGRKVETPQEGDIVLIRSSPWHVGLVTDPPSFIHCFFHGSPIRSDYTSISYRNRVEGFYRVCL